MLPESGLVNWEDKRTMPWWRKRGRETREANLEKILNSGKDEVNLRCQLTHPSRDFQ